GAEGAIAYQIRNSLYLNITNRCTNLCGFCVRHKKDFVKGHNLRLTHEPSADELKAAIGDPRRYDEIVFCGYGEPLLRLDVVKAVSRWVKDAGGRIRINTNGHGNLIHGRNIIPELRGIVDALSISIDAQDGDTYETVCRPVLPEAFESVLGFAREATMAIPEVVLTVVEVEGVDVQACRGLARAIGAGFRVRRLDDVG
ncbi:MAG: TatD family nuclease-associated radical SAM protein, partial [Thermodesulfovibrionales bacterium]